MDLPVVVQDHPASSGVYMSVELLASIAERAPTCGVMKLEDEPSPPKVGRLLGGAAGLRVLGGLGANMLLEELRRGAVGHDDRLRLPRVSRRDRPGVPGGRRGGAHGPRSTASCRSSASRTSPGINLAIRKHLYRRRGAIASDAAAGPGSACLDPGTIADLDAVLAAVGLADRLAPA